LAPTLRVGNGLDARFLSHDPAVVKAYQGDPLNHDSIGARLARFLADEGEFVQSVASRWTVPTLLVYAGQDRLVRPEGSRRFAAAAPPDVVRSVEYGALFHEIFNEVDAEPVFAELEGWLRARFAAGSPAVKVAMTGA
jgi:alpha-beta hydrolase superfamily lysophospholipase